MSFYKKDEWILGTIAVFFFCVYVFFVSGSDSVSSLRLKAIDTMYAWRHAALSHEPAQIPLTIVAIDDESLRQMRRRWPWDRAVYAEFLKRVSVAGPRVVGFDLSFSVPSENPAEDERFAEAIRENGRVLLGAYAGKGGNRIVGPSPPLARAAWDIGFLNFPRDRDHINRRHEPVLQVESASLYAFSLLAAAHFIGKDPKDLLGQGSGKPGLTQRGKQGVLSQLWSVYDYDQSDLEVIPFWKFFYGEVSLESVKEKILIVGATGEIFHDIYPTPIGVIPGVFLQANQILAYLNGNLLREIPPNLFYTLLLLGMVSAALLFFRLKEGWGLLLLVLLLLLETQCVFWFFQSGVLLDLFSILAVTTTAYTAALLYRAVRLLIENQMLRTQASKDGLTGLYTYRAMEQRLKNEFDRSRREGAPLSVIIFDLDHFKHLNDHYGHEKGNDILVAFSDILKSLSREEDMVSRYGGEEFCLLLPKRGVEDAQGIADRIRQMLEESSFRVKSPDGEETQVRVTVSAGICSTECRDAFNGKELLRLADRALLSAKENGRNRIKISK